MKPHQDSPLCITPSDLACIDPVFYIPAMDLIMSLQGSYVEALTLYDDTWRQGLWEVIRVRRDYNSGAS